MALEGSYLESMGAKVNGRLTPGPPIQILPAGEVLTLDGRPLPLDDETRQRFVADRARRKTPLIHNFEHEEDPRYGKDASGESSAIELRPNGEMWAMNPAWTDSGIEAIRSGAKTFISPEIYVRNGKLVNLRAIALVSTPNIDGMERVTASADGMPFDMPVPIDLCEEPMDPEEILARIREILGLPVAATEAEINEQISRLSKPETSTSSPNAGQQEKENMAFSPEFLKELGLADGASTEDIEKAVKQKHAATPPEQPELAARVEQLAAQVGQLNAAAEATQAEHAATRVKGIVERAVAEGRVTVAERPWFEALAAAKPDEAEKFAASLPMRAPVKGVISSNFTPLTLLHSEYMTMDSNTAHQKVLAYRAANPTCPSYEQAYLAVTQPGV